MKRLISLIIILIPIFNVSADEFLHGFIQGNYLLVGKARNLIKPIKVKFRF